jgi:hypothetical protein
MNLEALKSSIHGWFYTRFAVSFQTVPHGLRLPLFFPLLIKGKYPAQTHSYMARTRGGSFTLFSRFICETNPVQIHNYMTR